LLALNYEQGIITLKVYVTGEQKNVKVSLKYQNNVLFEEVADIAPEQVYIKTITADKIDEKLLVLAVHSAQGKELIKYEPASNKQNVMPEAAKPALEPADVENTEQLFLTGQHLEQYRHATYSPVPYYEEALRRDAKDIRNNNALGAWYLRRGQFAKSEPYFRKAIETSIQRNPNPYDSECYYNLGLALKFMGNIDEAYTSFYKATWSNAWKDSGFFMVAQLDIEKQDYELALEHTQAAIDRNANNSKAYVLRSAAYRKLNNTEAAIETSLASLKRDGFNLGALFELALASKQLGDSAKADGYLAELQKLSRGYYQNYIEYALDYANTGLYAEAAELLQYAVTGADTNPMVYYYLGYFNHKLGDAAKALAFVKQGVTANSYLCFPDRLEDIAVLKLASELNPADAKAPYYLGNLFYDKRQYDEAISAWETSAQLDDTFPTVLRNLAIAYFNKRNEHEKAVVYFEKAFALDKTDARILLELDQLYKRLNRLPEDRLAFLEDNIKTAIERDDIYLEIAALYNFLGQHDKALELVNSRQFHPWEGGEGKASGQYVYGLVQLARKKLSSGEFEAAIPLLEKAQVYPDNLGEGKLFGTQENDIFYWLGCAYEGLNQPEKATEYFKKATDGLDEPSAAVFYNDQQPDKIFYQGLAWRKLGDNARATNIFNKLVTFGDCHLNDDIKIDYFAVSLPNLLIFEDDLNVRNQAHCHYIQGLGYLGLEKMDEANRSFGTVLNVDAEHFGAKLHGELVTQQII
jgi:tetratricopeptide (TPR) repeat protein